MLSDDQLSWVRVLGNNDYNSLDNPPIKNLYGTQDDCVIISNLDAGSYMVHGYYKLNDDSEMKQADGISIPVEIYPDEENDRIYAVIQDIVDDSVSKQVITFDSETKEITKEQNIGADDEFIQDVNDNISGLQSSVGEINEQITSINDEISSQDQSISSLQNDVESHSSDISDINDALVNQTESISQINSSIDTINSSLQTHQSSIDQLGDDLEVLNDTESVQGSVRNIAKSYTDSLENSLASIAKSGDASDVSVSSPSFQSDNVEGALGELSTRIGTTQTTSEISVVRAQTPDQNDAVTYVISQGGVEKGKISIAKDLVATSGELVTEDGSGNPGTFIKMVIANGTPFYIPVGELIDVYQGSGDVGTVSSGVEVKVTNGVISASIKTVEGSKINDLSVSLAKLTQTLQDKIGLIDSAVFDIYEGATNGTISVDNQEVAVHGLKSAAFTESSAYDTAGTANTVKAELLGNAQTDTRNSKTIEGLIKRTDSVSDDVSALEEYVGQLPKGITSQDVVGYVTEVKNGISGSATIASKNNDIITIKNGITQTNGSVSNNSGSDIILSAVSTTGKAKDVLIDDSSNNLDATNVETAIAEIMTKLNNSTDSKTIYVAHESPLVYSLYQGSANNRTKIADITIPADKSITGGSLYVATASDSNLIPDKTYIRMLVANSDPVYIDVSSLVDIYQGTSTASGVQINVSNGTISATVISLDGSKIEVSSVPRTALASDVRASLDKADTAVQSVVQSNTNGAIKVNGQDVSVHGLGSAAYTNSTSYDESGAADAVRQEFLTELATYDKKYVSYRTMVALSESQKENARYNIDAVSQDNFDKAIAWKSQGTEDQILIKGRNGVAWENIVSLLERRWEDDPVIYFID